MENTTEDRPRPRPEPRTLARVLTTDLAEEIAALQREPTWKTRGHNAKTIIHQKDLRIVLVAMSAGAKIREHRTGGSVAIEVLDGEIRLSVEGEPSPVELGPRRLLVLEPGRRHDVDAVRESAFLLTVANP